MSQNAKPSAAPSQSFQTLLLVAVLAASCVGLGYLFLFTDSGGRPATAADPVPSKLSLAQIPFDGAKAYEYLQQICALGPRPSGSPGMQKQQELIAGHMQKLGGKVSYQQFRVRHPQTGEAVPMANMLVEWHPERPNRILLAAHYDTRPFPDSDRRDPRGTFIGANDGASGTALLMELGRHMPALKGNLGVDFVLFDGEEFVFNDQDPYFLGSEFFAMNYARRAEGSPGYRWAVVLDMIGDADLQLYQERNSMSWADTRPLVEQIWDTAARLGVREFVSQRKFEIRDDHLALHDVAGIPACDIIDFDYPHWHTQGDTADKCSALSLAKVGWVMHEWLTRAVQKR